jgi:hypothetical protein
MSRQSRNTATSLMLCILLAACGGGGGGSQPVTAGAASGATASTPAASSGQSGQTTASSTTGAGSSGSSSGTGTTAGTSAFTYDTSARFNNPANLALDPAGNLYVLDAGNNSIRKVAATGAVSTFASPSNKLMDLVTDASGNVLTLSHNPTPDEQDRTGEEIHKMTAAGTRTLVKRFVATPGAFIPSRISVDAQGRIYVLESRPFTSYQIERIDPDNSSRVVYSYATYGSLGDIAVDAAGDLAIGNYVQFPNEARIVVVPQAAQPVDQTSADTSTRPLQQGTLGNMVFDSSGDIFIADETMSTNGDSITAIRIMKIAADGTTTTLFNGFPDGRTSTATNPLGSGKSMGMTRAVNGDFYLTDPYTHAIYRMTPGGQFTLIAGKPGEAGNAD